MTQYDIIDALERQKQQLEEQLPTLLARCGNDAERLALRASYARTVQQWNDAVNKTLRSDNPVLAGLVDNLNSIQDEVSAMMAQAEDFGTLLNKIAAGIGIGAKILAFVK